MATLLDKATYFTQVNSLQSDEFTKHYLRTKWLIDPPDALDLESEDEGKVVCEVSVTDCHTFWQREATVADIKRGKPVGIKEMSKFSSATWAALSGKDRFEDFKLSCQITRGSSTITLKWSWIMEDTKDDAMLALPMILGGLELKSVSEYRCFKLWSDWLDFFICDRLRLQVSGLVLGVISLREAGNFIKRCEALEMRVADLEKVRDLTEQRMNKMVEDKLSGEATLLVNFRDLLNSKKRKTQKLMRLIEKKGIKIVFYLHPFDFNIKFGNIPQGISRKTANENDEESGSESSFEMMAIDDEELPVKTETSQTSFSQIKKVGNPSSTKISEETGSNHDGEVEEEKEYRTDNEVIQVDDHSSIDEPTEEIPNRNTESTDIDKNEHESKDLEDFDPLLPPRSYFRKKS
ncbi:hypothetical protein G9A89_018235 [Geosiphon pyriformis]|nr:hypothetical protein G9A89_018235 [Geosiphon pyriformis]